MRRERDNNPAWTGLYTRNPTGRGSEEKGKTQATTNWKDAPVDISIRNNTILLLHYLRPHGGTEVHGTHAR